MSLRSKTIRLASTDPELRPHLLPLLKSAGGISLSRMKDKGRMTFSTEGVYAHVWFDMGVAFDDFGRHEPKSGEWEVIVTTSEDPLNQKPRGRELTRETFRYADPKMKGGAMRMAEDFIKKMLFKYRK